MNLRQLVYFHEIVKCHLNVSAAAASLHTAQSGISKQIKLFETEIGARLFFRIGNRFTGMTPIGTSLFPSAKRIVEELTQIKITCQNFSKEDQDALVIATTHSQAHYVLPKVMKNFTASHPKVRFSLRHGNPAQITELLLAGEADLGLFTDMGSNIKDLHSLPCLEFDRVIVVPKKHDLLKKKRVTIALLAPYPLIVYDTGFHGRQVVLDAFENASLEPQIVLSASDADVMKACVGQGFGIAILLNVTYDAKRDSELHTIAAGHLFAPAKINVVFHRARHLRKFEYDFIEMLSCNWNRSSIEKDIENRSSSRFSKNI